MKTISNVAFEWSADDVQRKIDNLREDDQVIALSRIDDQHEFLNDVIEKNKFKIMELINELIDDAIYNEIK
jgi:hypothetical protein